MFRLKEVKNCTGCTACVAACPQGAIAVDHSAGYPVIRPDAHKCIDCGRCEDACPILAQRTGEVYRSALIAYSSDASVRSHSSSGGIFAMLALSVISMGGVVFGAMYRPDGICEQTWVEDASSLGALLGRKYVVSRVGSSYEKCKEFLLADRYVLYCGTPCQIEGLREFLGGGYSNLLCVEVGCGGVAAEGVWRAYVAYEGEPEYVEMTNRVNGENAAGLRLVYADGEKQVKRSDTAIHRAISHGLGIMPACVGCERGKKYGSADITLRRYDPALDNPKIGTSRQPLTMILVRTGTGAQAMERIKDAIKSKSITREQAQKHIRKNDKQKKYAFRSRKFISLLENKPFDEALEAGLRSSLASRIVRAAESVLLK